MRRNVKIDHLREMQKNVSDKPIIRWKRYGKYCEALSATQTNLVVSAREEKAHRTVGVSRVLAEPAAIGWLIDFFRSDFMEVGRKGEQRGILL
jgi:hypothetical protein